MKITTKQIEIIMSRWYAYREKFFAANDSESEICEQSFVFGAITQILDCKVGEVLMSDIPPAASMCLMSARPLSSVYPANPESVRLRGGR